jgi:alkylhydroperoxidase family enzyme
MAGSNGIRIALSACGIIMGCLREYPVLRKFAFVPVSLVWVMASTGSVMAQTPSVGAEAAPLAAVADSPR